MYNYENIPIEWFTSGRQSRSYCNPPPLPPPMSRPVSKSFNRISDFIFPDTVHIRFPISQRYQRTDNYSLPTLNRRDLVIVEHLPVEDFDNLDLIYREQSYQPNRPIRRRYSSIVDERRIPSNEKLPASLAQRSASYRERIRDRRKRHTTDNAYHSMLKLMLEEDEQQLLDEHKNSNYILSYKTTLEPITDSESQTSIDQQQQQQHYRVPINGTVPMVTEHDRSRQRQYSSTLSSHESSSDTDMTIQQEPSVRNFDQNVWEPLPHDSVDQSNRFIPINLIATDTNNQLNNASPFDNVSNPRINNQITSQDSTHHVSVCVNELRTTLFIDESTLNNTKINNNNNGKVVVKTFIDRIIKRLQHFKRSFDNGLIPVRKRNTLLNPSQIPSDYQSNNAISKSSTNQSLNSVYDNKYVRPYFLIRPQTLLMLPNEIAKFKCCFSGDPFPTLIWSHNDCRISEILATNNSIASKYKIHKLHDIYYLDIGPVNLNDNGQIKCTIMNRIGREEAIAQLLVVPSPADATPCIIEPLTDRIITEGQPLTLSCCINGLQVIVNWFHNGKLLSPTTQMKSDYYNENIILTLSCCLSTDAGTIDCHIKNRFGETRTSCHIDVLNSVESIAGESQEQ